MSTRGTLLLAAVCAALLGIYWGTGRIETERIREQAEARELFGDSLGDIDGMSIAIGDDDPVSATRSSEGQWKLGAPYEHVPANNTLWAQLAQVPALLTTEREIDANPNDLELYGLASPALQVTLSSAAGERTLRIGNSDPTQNNRYTRLDDGAVFLMPSEEAGAFYRTLDDLRDKRMMPEMGDGIDRIEFVRHAVAQADEAVENPQLNAIRETYERDEDGAWRVVSPFQAYAYQNKVVSLVNQLQFGVGHDFQDTPESLGDFGLDPEWALVTARNSKSGEVQTLRLGWLDESQDDGGMYAVVDGIPTVYKVDSGFVGLLPNAPGDFREKRLFTGQVSNLAAINYGDGRNAFTLTQNESSEWMLSDPPYDDTDDLIVSAFLGYLKRIPGETFPPEEEAVGLNPPRIQYEFVFADGSPSTSIAVGGPVPDSDPMMFYARQDNGTVTTIPLAAVRFLQSKPFKFRQRRLMVFEPNEVAAIRMTVGGTTHEFLQSESRWILTAPENLKVSSQSDIKTLLELLSTIDAVDNANPVPAEDVTGLTSPVLEVRLTLKSGNAVGPFRVGSLMASSSRYRFASTEGKDETYFVDQSILDDIRDVLSGLVPIN